MKMTFLYGVVLSTLLGYSIKLKMGDEIRHPVTVLFPSLFASHGEDDALGETSRHPHLQSPQSAKKERDAVNTAENIAVDSSGERRQAIASSLLWSEPPMTSEEAESSLIAPALPNDVHSSHDAYNQTEENWLDHLPTQEILHCNGVVDNAHFRDSPTSADTSILGAIKMGDWVHLTGKQVQADGIGWHEAIAPTLSPAINKRAQNDLSPNQIGWIASCFVH